MAGPGWISRSSPRNPPNGGPPHDPVGPGHPSLPSCCPLVQRQHHTWYVACRTWTCLRGRWPHSPARCPVQVGLRPTGGWMGPYCRMAPKAPSASVMGPSIPSCCQAWGLLTQAPSPTTQGPWSPRPSYWSKVPADGTLPALMLLSLLFMHASCRFLGQGVGDWHCPHVPCVGVQAGCHLAFWVRKKAWLRA